MNESIEFAYWLLHQRNEDPAYFSREKIEEFYKYYIEEVKNDNREEN